MSPKTWGSRIRSARQPKLAWPRFAFVCFFLLALTTADSASGQPPYRLTLGATTGTVGSLIPQRVLADVSFDPAYWWSYSVCIDPAILQVVSVSPGTDVLGITPSYYSVEILPDGWTSEMILSTSGFPSIGPGTGLELEVAQYVALAEGTSDNCFCTLGSPAVSPIFYGPGYVPIVPETVCGAVVVIDPVVPDTYILNVEETSGELGERVPVAITLDNQGIDVAAWSYGVCCDPTMISLDSVAQGSTTLALSPDFYDVQTDGDNWTVGLVIDFFATDVLAPGSGYELDVATYELQAVGTSTLCVCEIGGIDTTVVSVDAVAHDPILGCSSLTAVPPSGAYTLSATNASGQVGGSATVRVVLDVADGVATGWTFGMCHDETMLGIASIELGSDASDLDLEYFAADVVDGGWTTDVILDTSSPASVLPAGSSYELYAVTYDLLEDGSNELCFCDLGDPLVTPRIRNAFGQLVAPTTVCGGIVSAISAPECAATNLVEAKLLLQYPLLPDPESFAVRDDSIVEMDVTNRADEVARVELYAHFSARGVRRPILFDRFPLDPGETRTLDIDLESFGVDLVDLDFSGCFYVEARATSLAGVVVAKVLSPTFFFHQGQSPSGRSTHLYRSEARRALYRSGDLAGTIYPIDEPVPDAILGIFDGGDGGGDPDADSGPAAPNTTFTDHPRWEFCMRWAYDSIDSGYGEDYYTCGTLMKARGMHVMIDHANWTEPKEFYCSQDNGCFQFYSAENSGFVVTVYAEARLGDSDNIMVRAFDSRYDADYHSDDSPQWVFVANPGGSPRRVYYENEPSEISNLMAFGSFTVFWVDSHTNPGLAGSLELDLLTQACPSGSGGSCQPEHYAYIAPGDSNRKFLVGHEVGHWLHRQWTNDDMGYNDTTWSADCCSEYCWFDGVGGHAMRSKEYSAAGFVEGFAHFLSALAWNDHTDTDGIFKYYKEVTDDSYDDFADDNWRVDLEAAGANPLGGPTNWLESMCYWSDGYSVEMDWLRFFWDYRTNGGVKPSHHDIFEHIAFTRMVSPWTDNVTCYDRLLEAIQNGALGQLPFVDRWQDAAAWNGVDQ